MTLTFGLRTRFLVILLALVAVAAGLMVFKRMQSSSASSAPEKPARTAPTTKSKAAAPAATARAARKPAAPARPGVAATQQPPGTQLPAAIEQALTANRVVVVALYDPKAKIDETALQEATAGARLAGTSFVSVDVTKNEVAPLNARYGVIQDPAVLVLRPPGDLIVRIDGFADRDTVAQAAANAAS